MDCGWRSKATRKRRRENCMGKESFFKREKMKLNKRKTCARSSVLEAEVMVSRQGREKMKLTRKNHDIHVSPCTLPLPLLFHPIHKFSQQKEWCPECLSESAAFLFSMFPRFWPHRLFIICALPCLFHLLSFLLLLLSSTPIGFWPRTSSPKDEERVSRRLISTTRLGKCESHVLRLLNTTFQDLSRKCN